MKEIINDIAKIFFIDLLAYIAVEDLPTIWPFFAF